MAGSSNETQFNSLVETRSKQVEDVFRSYNNTIDSRSQQATTKLAGFTSNVDAFIRELNNKRTEYLNSSSLMNNAQALFRQLQTSANTIAGLISTSNTNITNTNNTHNLAKSELERIRKNNLEAQNNIAITKGHLQTANQAAQDAIIAKTQAQQHKEEAKGYSLAAKTSSETAAEYEAQTRAELEEAKETNKKMVCQYNKAKKLLESTSKTLQLTGGSSVADAALDPIQQCGFTNISETKFQEGLENYDYTSEELRRFAIAKSAEDRQNMTQNRLLQVSELLTQKDTIANNIIMDYMYKNEKGTNINTIMDKLTQLNNDKKRKLEITTYYNKSREQYINILKVIVLACIIIVPLVIANKNNMISNTLFMFITVAIILFTIIFTFSSFADIYKRDNMDFDKYNVPYDRETAMLEKDGSIVRKKNPLTSLTLTCIGQDCCDGSMVYDYAKNKCIATENFGNVFDTFASMNNNTQAIVYPNSIENFNNNCNFKNTLIQSSLACSSLNKFTINECTNPVEMQF